MFQGNFFSPPWGRGWVEVEEGTGWINGDREKNKWNKFLKDKVFFFSITVATLNSSFNLQENMVTFTTITGN